MCDDKEELRPTSRLAVPLCPEQVQGDQVLMSPARRPPDRPVPVHHRSDSPGQVSRRGQAAWVSGAAMWEKLGRASDGTDTQGCVCVRVC